MLYAMTYEVAQFYVPPAPKVKVVHLPNMAVVVTETEDERAIRMGGTIERMANCRETSGWRKSERSWKAHRHDQFGCGRL